MEIETLVILFCGCVLQKVIFVMVCCHFGKFTWYPPFSFLGASARERIVLGETLIKSL